MSTSAQGRPYSALPPSTMAMANNADHEFDQMGTELLPSGSAALLGSQEGSQSSNKKFWQGKLPHVAVVSLWALVAVSSFIAMIMAAWATHEARKGHSPSFLVAKPEDAPKGFAAVSLGSGTGYWAPEADMMYARSDHGAVSHYSYVFIFGGLSNTSNGDAVVLNNTVKFDTYTGVHTEEAKMPDPRYRFGHTKVGDLVYIIGGSNSNDTLTATPVEEKQVMVFNLTSNTWTVLFNALNVPRQDCCAATLKGKVFVMGGYDRSGHSLTTVEMYDPAAGNGWKVLDHQLNVGRADCRAATVNDNLMFVMGGQETFQPPGVDCTQPHQHRTCRRFLDSTEAFDLDSGKWHPKAKMLRARGDFAADILPSYSGGWRIFVAGGEEGYSWGDGNQVHFASHSTEEYIVADDVWVEKAPMPEARFRADMAHVWGRVYIFGGAPTCMLDTTAEQRCHNRGLASVFAYFDINYPNLYALVKLPRRLMRMLRVLV